MGKFKVILLFVCATFFWHLGHALPQDQLNAQDYQRWIEITQSVRCMVCQNQSVYDSSAPFAGQLKTSIASALAEGQSDEQIYTYLLNSYGNDIMLKPAFNLSNLGLWGGPILFLILAFWFLSRRLTFKVRP